MKDYGSRNFKRNSINYPLNNKLFPAGVEVVQHAGPGRRSLSCNGEENLAPVLEK
jgi:hypothetical protein